MPHHPHSPHRPGHCRGRDRGQVALEYLGFLPVLLIVALAAVQLGLVAYAAQQAGTAARAGARSASLDHDAGQGCRAAVSAWIADRTDCSPAYGADEVTVTATVTIPSVVPGWNGLGTARRTATMPLDSAAEEGTATEEEPAAEEGDS
ncbi:TadE/TadG family type IV pilus assembly protein [Streptomyces echinoruber]|uniref:Septum formation initiator n=1 Tax=Streptomyces echinoruber TaxID=68898 RepID=A0A918RC25_9ACTN|nr:TadE/TadG family type IV pilus assembly protein [Streptomyces echinoruber]GGZ94394.1 septum formation initiator [Streptomyces echinoruber]